MNKSIGFRFFRGISFPFLNQKSKSEEGISASLGNGHRFACAPLATGGDPVLFGLEVKHLGVFSV